MGQAGGRRTGGTASGKTAVIGAVQRKGNVVARVIASVSADDAHSVRAESRFQQG